MDEIRFGSACSGIEAASVAWHPLGWKAAWLSEIDPFASAVLAHHYPDVQNLGDMTKLPARIRAREIEAPDVFCGGTPCQAFSIAGLRKSLDDARGNLSLVFCEIADELDAARLAGGKPETIIFWENVPGVLTTADNAFGCFLAGLAGEDNPIEPPGGKWTNAGYVLGPQRAVAWRVLDAQYFGVAQRRRRVFVVASAREGFDPAAVLFEFEGVRRDTAPSREAGEGAAAGTLRSTDGGSDIDHARAGHLATVEVCPTLRAGGNRTGGDRPPGTDVDTADSLQVITMAHGQGGAEICFDRGPTLTCNHEAPIAAYAIQAVALRTNPNSGPDGVGVQEGHAYTLEARAEVQAVCCVHGTQDPCVSADTAFALGRNSGQENAIAFSCKDYGADDGEIRPTLRSMGHDGSHANAGGQVAVCFAENSRAEIRLEGGDGQRTGAISTGGGKPGQGMPVVAVAVQASQSGVRINDTIGTLDANYGSRRHNGVMTAMQVRRLTPVECERLQGFPDNYTLIPWRKKPAEDCPDGPRYKALGNSWAVPNVRWIGRRINAQLRALSGSESKPMVTEAV